jgi:hypothetical protein
MNIFQNSNKEKNNLQMMVGDHQRITRFKRLRLIPSNSACLELILYLKQKTKGNHWFIFSNRKNMSNDLKEISKCHDIEALNLMKFIDSIA